VVALVRVDATNRKELRSDLSQYLVELAKLEGGPSAAHIGRREYRWFDEYWSDDDRIPFWIDVSGETAGFCLIRAMDGGWNIAEFGIRPEWRRTGVGRRSVAVLAAAARNAGANHLRADVHTWNDRALRFWTSCGFRRTGEAQGVISTRLPLGPKE
jgi:ribosomal protein S18 acetylase RimI-like enzyme